MTTNHMILDQIMCHLQNKNKCELKIAKMKGFVFNTISTQFSGCYLLLKFDPWFNLHYT